MIPDTIIANVQTFPLERKEHGYEVRLLWKSEKRQGKNCRQAQVVTEKLHKKKTIYLPHALFAKLFIAGQKSEK